MPCNSDHMEASTRERDLSRVACLVDEINGKKRIDRAHWDGYHPRVYNEGLSKEKADAMVSELCAFLSGADVTRYSLEMQTWWRDHQEADRKRRADERAKTNRRRLKAQALNKLTPAERRVLGLKED